MQRLNPDKPDAITDPRLIIQIQVLENWGGVIRQKEEGLKDFIGDLEKHIGSLEKKSEDQPEVSSEHRKSAKELLKQLNDYRVLLRKERKALESAVKSLEMIYRLHEEYKKPIEEEVRLISESLQKSTENLLVQASEVEKSVGFFYSRLIKDNAKDTREEKLKINSNIRLGLDLCEKLLGETTQQINLFSDYFRQITLNVSPEYRREQDRVENINILLQRIYNKLEKIETDLQKAGMDSSAIALLKKEFAPLLLYNTIHLDDLQKTMQNFRQILQKLSEVNIPSIENLISSCVENDFPLLEKQLTEWRISMFKHSALLGARLFTPLISGALSIVLPVTQVASSVFVASAGQSLSVPGDVLTSATKEAASFSMGRVSGSISSHVTDPLRLREEKAEEKMAGVRFVKVSEDKTGQKKLDIDVDFLWRDVWYVKMLEQVNRKKLVLTVLSGGVSASLFFTGIGTLPAILGLAGSVTAAAIAIESYEEYTRRLKEAEVRFSTQERLDNIEEHLKLLEYGDFRKRLPAYYEETLLFIKNSIQGREEKLTENEINLIDEINEVLKKEVADQKQDTHSQDQDEENFDSDVLVDESGETKEIKLEEKKEHQKEKPIEEKKAYHEEKFREEKFTYSGNEELVQELRLILMSDQEGTLAYAIEFIASADASTPCTHIEEQIEIARANIERMETIIEKLGMKQSPLQAKIAAAKDHLLQTQEKALAEQNSFEASNSFAENLSIFSSRTPILPTLVASLVAAQKELDSLLALTNNKPLEKQEEESSILHIVRPPSPQ